MSQPNIPNIPDIDRPVLDRLRAECRLAGGQRAWALANRLSPQYLTDVLKGRRIVSDNVAALLGFERAWKDLREGGEE